MIDIIRSSLADGFKSWARLAGPLDVALPPCDPNVNTELLAYVARLEIKRLQLMTHACKQLSPEIYEETHLSEFVQSLAESSDEEVAEVLLSYNLRVAMHLLSQHFNDKRVARDEVGSNAIICQFTNAHTLLMLKKPSLNATLGLVFDERGHARFPRHARYLAAGPELANARVTAVVRDGELIVLDQKKCLAHLPISEFLDKDEAQWESHVHEKQFGGLRLIELSKLPGTDISLDTADIMLDDFLRTCYSSMKEILVTSGEFKHDQGFGYIDSWDPEIRRELALISSAIPQTWPDAARDLHDFTHVIVPFQMVGTGLAGASLGRMAGVTLHRYVEGDVADQATNLLHENAHKRYYAITSVWPSIQQGKEEMVRSPWRPDPRPVERVLVGLHAFCVVAMFYHRAISMGLPFAQGLEDRLATEIVRLNEGYETIRKHGNLTWLGEMIVEGVKLSIEGLD